MGKKMGKKIGKKIGFIGIGLMGHGIAKNILKAGNDLTFLDHPGNQPTGDLVEMGAKSNASAAEIAAASDVIFMVVTGSPQVEDVMFRQGGILEGLNEGAIVVDCSTSMPDSTLKVAEAVAARGAHMIDAPMTRTPREAEEGRLNVMIGGDEAVFESIRDLFEAYTENIYYGGPVSAGHKLKLLHNFLALGNSLLLAEAVACAAKGGVDLSTLCDVIGTGGGDSAVFRRIRPYIEEGDDSAFRFMIANGSKDMTYYADMMQNLGVFSFGAAVVQQFYSMAVNMGHGDKPVPYLLDMLGDMVGAKVKKTD